MAFTTNNAINLSDAGVTSYDGAGTFTGSVLTQHDVLVGGAANAIVSVTPSTAGLIFTSNGVSADPSFQVNPGTAAIKSIVLRPFTTTGTYTPTAGMVYCQIELVGGGGGGGAVSGIASQVQASGGGSGAAYARSVFSAATIGAFQLITIGAGGNSGLPGGANGGNGGTTSVGSLISADGGLGNLNQPIPPATGPNTFYSGVAGQSTATGTVTISGGNSPGATTNASISQASPGGTGGDSYFGRGGLGLLVSVSNPTGFGAGGSGAANNGGGSVPGGPGAAGYVLITEYIA